MQYHLTIRLNPGINHPKEQNDSRTTGKEPKTSERITDVLHLRLNPPAETDAPIEKKSKDVSTRNVLIVGSIHSGKSTISNVLENVCHAAEQTTLFGSTQEPILRESVIGGYQVRVLDTPGLFQQAKKGEAKRENGEIAQLIQESVKTHFGGEGYENVDTVLMPISFTAGVMSEDIEALKFFAEKLPLTTKKILVVTNAEGHVDNDRTSLLDQISQHRELSKLVDSHFGGTDKILFTGTLEEFDLLDEKTTTRKLKQVYLDRECMIKALLPTEEPVEFKQARLSETAKLVGAFLETHFPKVVSIL